METSIHIVLLITSVALFIAACLCPALDFRAFTTDGPEYRIETDRGATLLFTGCLGALMGHVMWLANPLWLAGGVYLFMGRLQQARISLCLAIVCASTTLLLRGKMLPRDEGGVTKKSLDPFRAGFYLWIGSLVLALIASHLWPAG